MDSKIILNGLNKCVELHGREILGDIDKFKFAFGEILSGSDCREEYDILCFVISRGVGCELLGTDSNEEAHKEVYYKLLNKLGLIFKDEVAESVLQSLVSALGWKDVETLKKSLLHEVNYADKQKGDLFTLGRYPQGVNDEIEPIFWRVLRRDNDGLLVRAELSLDVKPYNDEYIEVTWADCSLRRWLNEEFYNSAFNDEERSLIKLSSIDNNFSPSTEDHLFLLSADEVKDLFRSDNRRKVKPTHYAINNGVYIDDYEYNVYIGNAWWWLRSSASKNNFASYISCSGDFSRTPVNNNKVAVCPAFKLIV